MRYPRRSLGDVIRIISENYWYMYHNNLTQMQDRLAQGLIHSHSCPAQLLCPRQEWVQHVCPQRCGRVGSQWLEQS